MKKIRLFSIRRIFVSLMLSVFAFSSITMPVANALSEEHRSLLNKNILYYDPSCTSIENSLSGASVINNQTYMLGDSITLGAKDELDKEFRDKGINAQINASVSRSIVRPGTTSGNTTSGIEAVDQDTDSIGDAKNIIIALGTNKDNRFKEEMSGLVEKVKEINKDATVYWVNIFSNVSHKRSTNRDIQSVASERNVTVIETAGKDIPLSDGVHPEDPAGQKKFAKIVADSLRGTSLTAQPQGGGDGCACQGSVTGGSNNTEIAYNFLVSKGIKPMHAAAMVGNFIHESGGDPLKTNNPNPGSGANGIAHWLGGRLTGLYNFAREKGKDWKDIHVQLDYLWEVDLPANERHFHTLEKLKATTNLADAVAVFEATFERSGVTSSYPQRTQNAERVLSRYGSGSTGGASSGTDCGSGTSTGQFIWPLDKKYPVTSCYGYARGRLHTGIDIGAPAGTEIKAADGGTVELARDSDPGGFGKAVIIKHDGGNWTLYAHLRTVSVRGGEKVSQGQKIGEVNNTGSSQGDHLHFNIQTQGGEGQGSVDPLKHLPRDGRGISGGDCPSSLN